MGATTPEPEHQLSPAVLVLAPTGRDAELSCQTLRSAGVACESCDGAEEMIERVRAGSGPVVMAAEAVDADLAGRLSAALAEQPTWSDLPLILLVGRGMPPQHLRRLAARRNTTVLHRPLKVPTFVTTARSALQDRRRQYEVRDLLGQLEQRANQLQRLALQLTQTEEQERHRLAQVLHDDLQQVLAGAKFHVALLPKRARESRLDDAVKQLGDLLEQAIEKSRSLSHELSPPTLQQHGLPEALDWLAQRMQQHHGMTVRTELAVDADPADGTIRVFLYRCAQELLFNVVKHAGVREATLRLSADEDRYRLQICDAGQGFDPGAALSPGSGLGLLSIHERASLLGGALEMQGSDAGSSFMVTLPREGAAAVAELSVTSIPAPADLVEDPAAGDEEHPHLRILLADDHEVMRNGLRALLEEQEDMEVVAEADDGVSAVDLADQHRPDVVLMDVSMPRMDGIEATRRIKARHGAMRVIALSMFDDQETAAKMREAGAARYLPKAGPGEQLIAAVRGSGRHTSP